MQENHPESISPMSEKCSEVDFSNGFKLWKYLCNLVKDNKFKQSYAINCGESAVSVIKYILFISHVNSKLYYSMF